MPESIAYNVDCMEYLRSVPDKYFDLAVVDPPYGDASSQNGNVERERAWKRSDGQRFGGHFDKYRPVEPLRSVVRPIQVPPQEPLNGQVVHGQANTGKKSSRGT